MKVKALKSFTGAVCMSVGEVTNITDKVIANDLVNAGYVECLESDSTENVSDSDTKKNATSKRSAKKDEDKSDPKE